MRSILTFVLLVSTSRAATWYATASSTNINAASLWVPTQGSACAGGGTALVFGSQANGDIFEANGCTALAVNVDPGSTTVQVTLRTTSGGGFTFATTTGITVHANILAGTSVALTTSGASGTGTISGTVTGGTSAASYGITTGHTTTSSLLNILGTVTGGSGSNAYGINVPQTGPVHITGDIRGGGSSTAYGLQSVAAAAVTTVTGNCVGSDTFLAAGCSANVGGTVTITGDLLNGLKGSAVLAGVRLAPSATNYACYPADASYVLFTGSNAATAEDCTHTGGGAGLSVHAVELPLAPAAANVKTGVQYGSQTGTAAGGVAVYPIN